MKVTRNAFLNRRGFGIHSPWAYDLITNVIEETLPYYAYDDLYEFWEKSPECLPQYDENVDQLLFRLVNALHPRRILEIGTGAGVSTAYLASVSKAVPVLTLDFPNPASGDVKSNLEVFSNVQYITGDVLKTLTDCLAGDATVDFVHIAHTAFFKESFETVFPHLNEKSVVVVEGIRSSARNKWFDSVAADGRTGVVVTKGSVGMLFFDMKMYKEHYRL